MTTWNIKLIILKRNIRKKCQIFDNIWVSLVILLCGFAGLYYLMLFKADHVFYFLHYFEIFIIALILGVLAWFWGWWDNQNEPFGLFIITLMMSGGCLLLLSILSLKILPEKNLQGTIYTRMTEVQTRKGVNLVCKMQFDVNWLNHRQLVAYPKIIEQDFQLHQAPFNQKCHQSGEVRVYEKVKAKVQSGWLGARVEWIIE